MLYNPTGVAVDKAGNLYIADQGNREVEKVSPNGVLTVVAGTGSNGGPTAGPAVQSTFEGPLAVAVDPRGGLYVADVRAVVKISRTGILSIVIGTTCNKGPTGGPIGIPYGLAVGPAGSLYIADAGNSVVERITPKGRLSVVAGTGVYGRPKPGLATHTRLGNVNGVAVSRNGTLYIADAGNEIVERVGRSGRLSIVAGNGHYGKKIGPTARTSNLGYPNSVATEPHGRVDILSDSGLVERLHRGKLTLLAGTGKLGPPTVGPARKSDFGEPFGIAVDREGTIYTADQQNNVIEAITS